MKDETGMKNQMWSNINVKSDAANVQWSSGMEQLRILILTANGLFLIIIQFYVKM